jgi:hypothetical protein
LDKHRFKTTVELTGRTATFIKVPLDIPALFDGAKKPPVRVTINGHTYRSTIAVYGGEYFLPLNRKARAASGVEAGDTVTVEIERDVVKRVVRVPADLKKALASDSQAEDNYKSLSYSHKKEYVDWIEDAKRAETRDRRINKAIEMLRAGKHR